MMPEPLTIREKQILLEIARQAITQAAAGMPLTTVSLADLTPALCEDGAAFVTLTARGNLRGCIGALAAYQPLALDVQEHAVSAATEDFRFPPVRPAEVPGLHIEISRLTPPVPLDYASPEELPARIMPGRDGVTIQDGMHRATFLPQVWESLPSPEEFLAHLCMKMGAPANLWRRRMLQVSTYQVEMFEEGKA